MDVHVLIIYLSAILGDFNREPRRVARSDPLLASCVPTQGRVADSFHSRDISRGGGGTHKREQVVPHMPLPSLHRLLRPPATATATGAHEADPPSPKLPRREAAEESETSEPTWFDDLPNDLKARIYEILSDAHANERIEDDCRSETQRVCGKPLNRHMREWCEEHFQTLCKAGLHRVPFLCANGYNPYQESTKNRWARQFALFCTNRNKRIVIETLRAFGDYANCTAIADRAFVRGNYIDIEKLPDTIVTIGEMAFLNCGHIQRMQLPSNLQSIGKRAFAECVKLGSLKIPDSVHTIGPQAFKLCTSLTTLSFPQNDNFVKIAKELCEYSGLTSILIPNTVTEIEENAFWYCDRLTSVVVPDTVTKMNDGIFGGCHSMVQLTLPKGLKTIHYQMVLGCRALTSITIPESVEHIDVQAFEGCKSLKEVTIPAACASIGEYAFAGCDALEVLHLPDLQGKGRMKKSATYRSPLLQRAGGIVVGADRRPIGEETIYIGGGEAFTY